MKLQCHDEIKQWLIRNSIRNYTINNDLTVDVAGSVELCNIREIPIQFGYIGGNFSCSHNPNLVSLVGCPHTVEDDFRCSNCNLTSLEGCPIEVMGGFYCQNNKLTSLKHFPEYVGGNINCYHNEITTLEGCPQHVSGDFYCSHNKLTSLRHIPQYIGEECSFKNNLLVVNNETLDDWKEAIVAHKQTFNHIPNPTEELTSFYKMLWEL